MRWVTHEGTGKAQSAADLTVLKVKVCNLSVVKNERKKNCSEGKS